MMRFEGRPLDDSDPLFAPLIALDRKRGTAFWRPSAKWKKAGYKGGAVRLSGVLGDGLDAVSDDLEDVEDVVFGEDEDDEEDEDAPPAASIFKRPRGRPRANGFAP